MHTVELLLDDALEAGVRSLWDRLHAAGLASLARHRHVTNRPHVTLVSAVSLAGLPVLPLPLDTVLGPVRLLGRALAREVADTPALRRLQNDVWQAVGSEHPHYAPGRWIPHVSLALNVPPDQQKAACALLADIPPVAGRLIAARSYDTGSRTVTML
ncbi:hypothetical protein [Actinoplanes utahensis]|uniref:2'-5' RNA ligase n=1 Tax=Actinoplanes utahensis TaxID=1869 RepID=A0A0A6URX7_ACTUT|nr:hypothetical protein [Actinoplanes utahensis]KHD78191.1 hypothetical protein MB27_07040 [Actinoplanes utahensis]GIF30707.1 2'-5' RNA ligase [Actinoplanes utahensis]